jgi:hypothetical protein
MSDASKVKDINFFDDIAITLFLSILIKKTSPLQIITVGWSTV